MKKITFIKNNIPTPGIEPGPRRWERRILTTRPYGMDAVQETAHS